MHCVIINSIDIYIKRIVGVTHYDVGGFLIITNMCGLCRVLNIYLHFKHFHFKDAKTHNALPVFIIG